ncbi:MAG TPA: 23S rRNA (guanosine(2251)-2'-O)-methyltransferase RlmB [Pyrinomonadaceae bacterium]|nr:23S rRNA (guanosine(2251)-2'-O)-methyltransferase RlmB [Pyrinomonadaceae bacterium]
MKKKRADQAVPENHGLLYGVNPLLEALRAGDRIPEEVVIAEGAKDHRLHELIELARARKIPVRRSPRAALDRTVGNTHHQGVMARIPAVSYADSEDLLSAIAARVGGEVEPLAIVLDGVEDPRNLGAILRTSECAGVDGVFVPERRAAGLSETVAKASAGAIEHVPVARVTNLSLLIKQLKERNVWVIGTAADASMEYTEWDWTKPSALVLGGEGAGLHRLIRERCDVLVRIPVHGRIESLNVSVAAGIILYEALRQRKNVPRAIQR